MNFCAVAFDRPRPFISHDSREGYLLTPMAIIAGYAGKIESKLSVIRIIKLGLRVARKYKERARARAFAHSVDQHSIQSTMRTVQ